MKKSLAIIGATAVGFVAGVLLAPKSGKETISDIKEKSAELKKKTDKYAKKAKLAAKDGFDSVKTGAKKVGDVTTETVNDIKENVNKRFN